LKLARVFNDHDFGGYLIANGAAPFNRQAGRAAPIEPAVDAKAK